MCEKGKPCSACKTLAKLKQQFPTKGNSNDSRAKQPSKPLKNMTKGR